MNNCERIKLQAGDWIKLSEIPNEQVFNLVKQCFINAGFNDCNGKYAQWENAEDYKNLGAGLSECSADLVEFTNRKHERQISLSDVFNSLNGGMDWQGKNYIHSFDDGGVILTNDAVISYAYSTHPVERIQTSTEAPEAIIPPKVSQWWDCANGCAVGLPEKGELVLYQDYRKGLITVEVLGVCLKEEVVWTKGFFGDGNSFSTDSKESFKPVDYKTPKQALLDKALDLAAQNMSFEVFIERLYEAGLLKGGE